MTTKKQHPVAAYWAKIPAAQRSKEMKRRAKLGRLRKLKMEKENVHGKETNEDDAIVSYAFGYVQSWLNNYEERLGVAKHTLAKRVGRLLQSS